jgi:hypothetical protein
MRCLLVGAGFLLLSVAPALAQSCSPPAGLGIEQWYGVCQQALQQAYSMGMGQGAPFQVFVQSAYQVYAQPVGGQNGDQNAGQNGGQSCELGASECFNGYARTCQQMPTGGTWWITGSQQCQ